MNILIVDDDEDILKSFEIGLEDYSYRTMLCNNPLKAIELYKAHPFDLVISDIKMPEMDGLELLKRLKEIDPSARIVLITAFVELKNAVEAIRNQVYSFMLKPVDIYEIIQIIEDIKEDILLNKNEKEKPLK